MNLSTAECSQFKYILCRLLKAILANEENHKNKQADDEAAAEKWYMSKLEHFITNLLLECTEHHKLRSNAVSERGYFL